MTEHIQADICIIGAGVAGLTFANAAAQLGANIILIDENTALGGNSLRHNCIPTKSFLSSSRIAEFMRNASQYGIEIQKHTIDHASILKTIQNAQEEIGLNYTKERFEGMGAKVIQGQAEFISPSSLRVDDITVTARRFVIATGSKPATPPYPGLTNVNYFTHETILKAPSLPQHLIILGGDSAAIEMAQAFTRMGKKVTLLEIFTLLGQYDKEAVTILRKQLIEEGVEVKEHIHIRSIEQNGEKTTISIIHNDSEEKVTGSALLVSAGRQPNYKHLNLAIADVESHAKGIIVDDRLRTTNKKIFALGDVIGHMPYAHVAQYQASIVMKNILFYWPAKINYTSMPKTIFTEPGLAQTGLTEAELLEKKMPFQTLRSSFHENQKAIIHHKSTGMIKVVISKKGRVLGASIAGPQAEELIVPWIMAVKKQMKVTEISDLMIPYLSYSEIHKHVAVNFFVAKIFNGKLRKFVKFIQKYL